MESRVNAILLIIGNSSWLLTMTKTNRGGSVGGGFEAGEQQVEVGFSYSGAISPGPFKTWKRCLELPESLSMHGGFTEEKHRSGCFVLLLVFPSACLGAYRCIAFFLFFCFYCGCDCDSTITLKSIPIPCCMLYKSANVSRGAWRIYRIQYRAVTCKLYRPHALSFDDTGGHMFMPLLPQYDTESWEWKQIALINA